jgi:hypothetical protein
LIAIVNNFDWVCWNESLGGTRLLHWYSYSFLEKILNCFADFATVFENGKFMSESGAITKLNTKALVCVLTGMKTICDQIKLHQAMMTPIAVMPGVVAAHTLSQWNSTQVCGPKRDN